MVVVWFGDLGWCLLICCFVFDVVGCFLWLLRMRYRWNVCCEVVWIEEFEGIGMELDGVVFGFYGLE